MRTNTIPPMDVVRALSAESAEHAKDAEVPSIEMLFSRHSDSVARWAARLGGPWMDGDDVVQDVFLVAQRRLPEFRGDCSPATWLYRITERVVWNRRRRERIRRWWRGKDTDVTQVASDRPTPLEVLQSKEASILFYRVLEGLSERYRSVIVLFELEGLSGQEIAELKGVAIGTIWVWLHRARAQLATELVKLERRAP